jgi:membrane associated rhomboid family serine protease
MSEVALANGNKSTYIDICPSCHIVWFDTDEYDELPKMVVEQKTKEEMSPKAKEAFAIAQVKIMSEKQKDVGPSLMDPDDWPQAIPAMFGLPVEADDEGLENKPVITWILALIIAAVGIAELLGHFGLVSYFPDYKDMIKNWGLIPADFSRYYGLTFVTSVFLHGNVFYFLLNLYFLMVFGEHVEDVLGRWRYLLLIVCAAMAGAGLHIVINSTSQTPYIGAIAAIAGVITYYALRFPRAEIGFLYRFGRHLSWSQQPALTVFLSWIVIMFFIAYRQVNDGLENANGISALAILGGAAAGFAFWLVTLRKNLLSDQ